MTQQDLNSILKQNYPKAVGFSITGSQSKNQQLNPRSDIDVLVFDTSNSDVTSAMIVYDEHYKIDCTIIPILNIENVIANEFGDTTGTIFNMILESGILHDPYSILTETKSILLGLDKTMNNKVIRLSKTYNKNLVSFKKYFDRELDQTDKIIMLADFVTLLTKIALIDKIDWDADRFRKVKILKKESPALLKEITDIYHAAMQAQDLRFLNSFIDHFQMSLRYREEIPGKTIVIDFGMSEFSMLDFCREILPMILENPLLKNSYQYFYLSPKKYYRLYKNNVSVCFDVPENVSYAELLSAIAMILPYKNGAIMYEPVDILGKYKSTKTCIIIGSLRNQLSAFYAAHCELFSKEILLPELICQMLLFSIINQLDFDSEDIIYLNNWLLQKWLMHIGEQRVNGGYKLIEKTAKSKVKMLDEMYEREKKRNPFSFHNKGDISSVSEKIDKEFFRNILTTLTTIISDDIMDWKLNLLPESMFSFLQIKKIREAQIYLILTEELLQMFNIPDNRKSRILYFAYKSISDSFLK